MRNGEIMKEKEEDEAEMKCLMVDTTSKKKERLIKMNFSIGNFVTVVSFLSPNFSILISPI